MLKLYFNLGLTGGCMRFRLATLVTPTIVWLKVLMYIFTTSGLDRDIYIPGYLPQLC